MKHAQGLLAAAVLLFASAAHAGSMRTVVEVPRLSAGAGRTAAAPGVSPVALPAVALTGFNAAVPSLPQRAIDAKAAIVPAMIRPMSAAVPAAPAAQPLNAGGQLSELSSGRMTPQRAFDAGRVRMEAPDAVPAGAPGYVPSLLVAATPSAQESSEPAPPQPPRPSGPGIGKAVAIAAVGLGLAALAAFLIPNTVAAWIVAGLLAAGALVWSGILYKGAKRGEEWTQSPAAADSRRIEAVRADPDALGAIAAEVEARARGLEERIRQAEASGSGKLADGTPVAKAKRLVVYDEVAGAKAKLYRNSVAREESARLGEKPLAAWQTQLYALDREAALKQFEGYLMLGLRPLEAELGRQRAAASAIDAAADRFDELETAGAGAAMKAELETVRRELATFAREIDGEQALASLLRGAMFARQSARFYASDPEFKRRTDRRDRLAGALSASLQPAAALAERLDRRLQEVVVELQREQQQLVEAERNLRVPVTKVDDKGNEYIDYEDRSGPYRAQAANHARQAAAEARAARREQDELDRALRALRSNAVLVEEGLAERLPRSIPIAIEDGADGTIDHMDLTFALSRVQSYVLNAQNARGEFVGLERRIAATRDETAGRRDAETRWLSSKVDAELARQEAQARANG